MRDILFLAHRLPWPPDRGDKIRSWHLLKRLAGIARVHVVCFADDEAELANAGALAPFAASQCVVPRNTGQGRAALLALLTGRPLSLTLFGSADIRSFVAETMVRHDIGCIFAFSSQMAQFVPVNRGDTRFVMDFVDVDSAKFARYADHANPVMRRVYAREARLLAAHESLTAARAETCLLVSEAESALFRKVTGLGADKVRALQNGVDLAYFDPEAGFEPVVTPGALIVFTGQMDYRPNIEAVIHFARETLPLIRAERPDARFAIVGRKAGSSVQALATLPGVIVTGEVPDVRGWLAAASVVVAPLGIARGVQNKVLEAMSMARPVVASPAAFEGIEASAGSDLLVANGAVAEARIILRLLADPDAARGIGNSARARIAASYGWEARLAGLAAIIGMHGQAQ